MSLQFDKEILSRCQFYVKLILEIIIKQHQIIQIKLKSLFICLIHSIPKVEQGATFEGECEEINVNLLAFKSSNILYSGCLA